MITKKYEEYVTNAGQNVQKVLPWIRVNLKNALTKKGVAENQTEIEHILDYLSSSEAPERIKFMSYEEAKVGAEKWVKRLRKKGADIIETDNDVVTSLDFNNGVKFVRLKSKNAFKREGFLMSHCLGSYNPKSDVEIYSLRDAKNQPHCTIEVVKGSGDGRVQQVKGKGNGSIHPKYVKYVLTFLKQKGMDVRDNEMQNLGYDIPPDGAHEFLEKHFKDIKYVMFNNKKYLYRHQTFIRKHNS